MEIGPGEKNAQQLQQPDRGRRPLLEPVEGQVPGRHDRHRVIRRLVQGQDPGGLGRQLLDVDPGGHPGLLQPRAGLLDRQRQVAQGVGDPLRVGQVQLGHVPQQVRRRFRPG